MEAAVKAPEAQIPLVRKPVEQLFDGKSWVQFDKSVARPDPLDTVQLLEEHKALIRSTWAPMKGNLVESGTKIFERIFEVGPRIRDVFFRMLSAGGDTMSEEGLQLHAIRFMQALDAAVDDIDDLARQVAPMFINLGRRHIYFKGLVEGDFDGFTGAILYVFNQDMGESFTPDVRVAWGRLLDYLIQHLKHGFVMARDAAK